MHIKFDKETDGRIIAEAPEFRGALAYGRTQAEAAKNVVVMVLRIMADRIEHGEKPLEFTYITTSEGVQMGHVRVSFTE